MWDVGRGRGGVGTKTCFKTHVLEVKNTFVIKYFDTSSWLDYIFLKLIM